MLLAAPLLAFLVVEPNAIGISLGVVGRSQRDENFNNARYAGGLGSFGLHYDRIGAKDRHSVVVAGGAGVGTNRYDKSILWIDLMFRYAYQHALVDDVVRFSLGGSVGGGPRMFQFRDEDADHVHWETRYDLSVRGVVDWHTHDRRRRRHGIEGTLELPLLGLVSRPPELVTYNNDKPSFGPLMARAHHAPRFSSWHNVQAIRVGAWWSLRLSSLVEQRLGYATEYVRVAFPREFVSWSHHLAYRIDFVFGGVRHR